MPAGQVPAPTVELARGIGFTEGPLWTFDGRLLVTSASRGAIWEVAVDGGEARRVLHVGGAPTGLCQEAGGAVWIVRGPSHRDDATAADRIPAVMCWTDDVCSYKVDGLISPNDCVIGPDSRLWFTDPAGTPFEEDGPPGQVRVLDPATGESVVVAGCIRYPNGLVFDRDGTTLYVAETGHRRVLAFSVGDASLAPAEVFAQMPTGHPDGLAMDAEGKMYAALSDGHAVAVISPGGEIAGTIAVPERAFPTNVTLGGASGRDLFITAASGGRVLRASL
jgi:gluconolactonase